MADRTNNRSNGGDDLGLGTKTGTSRGVNKDGSFNVRRKGQARFRPYELYHQLITMSAPKFLLLVVCAYTLVNLIFASIYYLIGMQHLAGIAPGASESQRFMEAFFFSSQTLTTLGYGRIAPVGSLASTVAAVESLLGLLTFAVATGLLYGRFSRPRAKILYSHHGVIAPYRDTTGFMFRIVNQRTNQLIEVEATVSMSFQPKDRPGRAFLGLKLEREKISLFPTNWTLVHPIIEGSPLYGVTEDEFRKMDAEFIILIKAFDDTFAQTVYSRSSYKHTEIIWGAKFKPMFTQEEGTSVLDITLIDDMERVKLPEPEVVA